MVKLLDSVVTLKYTGVDRLADLAISTYFDLFLHIPLRYEDLTTIAAIKDSYVGQKVLVEGQIVEVKVTAGRKPQLHVILFDQTDYITLTFFHFYPNYKAQYQIGKVIRAYGEIRSSNSRLTPMRVMIHPKIKTVNQSIELATTFGAVYPITQGLKQEQLAKIMDAGLALFDLEHYEVLPKDIISTYQLPHLGKAVLTLHKLTAEEFNLGLHNEAKRRLKLDELIAQQLTLLNIYQDSHALPSRPLKPKATYTKELFKILPFKLTTAQTRVLAEIYMDMAKATQMNRLLQGDVGSGKTIVALLTMLVAVENGCQACIIAPTEILAQQHYLKLKDLLDKLGVELGYVVGSLTAKQKQLAYAAIASGEMQVIVGTHALIQDNIKFNDLGVVVVDEQHRFGVEQRLLLQQKGFNPHQLMMSATPIPRSLAMSYYAHLDVSVIDELPPGRGAIDTLLISNKRRGEVVKFVASELAKSAQVYWVCPLIEESEALDLENALGTYDELSAIFLEHKVGLIHGKLKVAEKSKIMHDFAAGVIKLLVATTVIEVGVDVANATVMVIEHSERMGLAQLHQLRGRIGRGNLHGHCILLYQEPLGEIAKRRLKAIHNSTDGFAIAEEDLKIRGPGEILGSRQSGLPKLRVADIEEDQDLVVMAKDIAKLLKAQYPQAANLITSLWFHNSECFLNA